MKNLPNSIMNCFCFLIYGISKSSLDSSDTNVAEQQMRQGAGVDERLSEYSSATMANC